MAKKEVNGLTSNLTIKGDNTAARTITIGQRVTFEDIVSIAADTRNASTAGVAVTTASANALAIGRQGTTSPAFWSMLLPRTP